MSDSLLAGLMSQLEGGGIDAISRQVGVSRDQAMQVASGALPALLGGLDRNSQDPAEAAALAGALDRDHDGSVLDGLHGFSGPMLVHLVKRRVLPGRWADPFVMVGYSAARKRLVVIHHREVQRAVGAFMDRLARDGQKALEK